MSLIPIVRGLLTYIPGATALLEKFRGGKTGSAAYCYGVWLKHLTLLGQSGLRSVHETVAELGPGGSLGIGLAALLSGASRYFALDVTAHADADRNLEVLDGLVELFSRRAPRPQKGWPDFDAQLDANLFPGRLLTDDLLRRTLQPERVERIRRALRGEDAGDVSIRYFAPWNDPGVIAPGAVDLLLSHSVLEHVDDLEGTYRALAAWLKPGGWMSHQVDLGSHGTAAAWNGHWACSEAMWKLILGRRRYLINRQPVSRHMDLVRQNGFEIVCELKRRETEGITRSQLAPRWQRLADDDLACSGLFLQARKP